MRTFAAALLPLGLLVACSEPPEPVDDGGLLQFVPADTPYAFVSGRHLPEALRGRLADHAARQLSVQRAALTEVRKELEADPQQVNLSPAVAQFFAVADALLAEFEGRDTAVKLRELGLEPTPLAVYYGIGLLPAARIEIADADAFNALLDRVEKKSGVAAEPGVSAGQAYRRIDLGVVDVVLAVTPEYLVLGLLPDALFGRELPLLLGQRSPASSLEDQGVIAEIAARHGFEGYGEGFVKLDLLADTLLGRADGRNAEVMRALGAEAVPLPAGCLQLMRGMVAGMPRMVVGISAADTDRLAIRGIWESSEQVATYLRRLATPVPGLGAEYNGLMSIGVGVDIPELRNGIAALLRALIDKGQGCEWVDPATLEAAIPQLSLVLGPMTAGIRGFNVQIADVEIDPVTLLPSAIEASVLAAVDDPRGVFALGAMLDPALAAVEVPNDGTPVDLPAGLIPDASTPPLKVAMQDKALLVMTDAAAMNSGALFTAPTGVPAPLFAVDYGVAQLVEVLDKILERAGAQLTDQGEVELAAQLRAQMHDFKLQAEVFDRLRVSLYASDQGLVLDQSMQLR
jgi:hypothetical protein